MPEGKKVQPAAADPAQIARKQSINAKSVIYVCRHGLMGKFGGEPIFNQKLS